MPTRRERTPARHRLACSVAGVAGIATWAGGAIAWAGHALAATSGYVDPDPNLFSGTIGTIVVITGLVGLPVLVLVAPPGVRRVALAVGLLAVAAYAAWSATWPSGAGSSGNYVVAALAIADIAVLAFWPRVASAVAMLAALAASLAACREIVAALACFDCGPWSSELVTALFVGAYALLVLGFGAFLSVPTTTAPGPETPATPSA